MILKMIIKVLIKPPKAYVPVFFLQTVKQQIKNMETINETGQNLNLQLYAKHRWSWLGFSVLHKSTSAKQI